VPACGRNTAGVVFSGHAVVATDRSPVAEVIDPLFAAVAPGNAASFRAFLAAGFQPLAAQVVIQPS
jgi:hypothetical protein